MLYQKKGTKYRIIIAGIDTRGRESSGRNGRRYYCCDCTTGCDHNSRLFILLATANVRTIRRQLAVRIESRIAPSGVNSRAKSSVLNIHTCGAVRKLAMLRESPPLLLHPPLRTISRRLPPFLLLAGRVTRKEFATAAAGKNSCLLWPLKRTYDQVQMTCAYIPVCTMAGCCERYRTLLWKPRLSPYCCVRDKSGPTSRNEDQLISVF